MCLLWTADICILFFFFLTHSTNLYFSIEEFNPFILPQLYNFHLLFLARGRELGIGPVIDWIFPSPEFIGWITNPQRDGIRSWGLCDVLGLDYIGHKGEELMIGLVLL